MRTLWSLELLQNLYTSNHNKKELKNFIKSCLLSYHNWMSQFKIKIIQIIHPVLEHCTILGFVRCQELFLNI